MKLSRHVRNNMSLYKINEKHIIETVESPESTGKEGGNFVALRRFLGEFSGYPLKVVYEKTGEEITIITVYPLRKKYQR